MPLLSLPPMSQGEHTHLNVEADQKTGSQYFLKSSRGWSSHDVECNFSSQRHTFYMQYKEKKCKLRILFSILKRFTCLQGRETGMERELREGEGVRGTGNTFISVGLLHKCMQSGRKEWMKLRSRNSIQIVSHVHSRDPTTWAITLASSWTWTLNSYSLIWDSEILTGV